MAVLDVKRERGRPIEYTEAVVQKLAADLVEWIQIPDNLFLQDFCFERRIPVQTLSEQAEKHAILSEALKLAKQKQAAAIAKGGLKGKYNAQMAKFTLMNVAGWRESGQMDVTSNGQALGYVALPQAKAVADAEVIELED